MINSARRQESSKRLKKAPSIDSNTSHQETGELLVKSPDAIIKEAKEDVSMRDNGAQWGANLQPKYIFMYIYLNRPLNKP